MHKHVKESFAYPNLEIIYEKLLLDVGKNLSYEESKNLFEGRFVTKNCPFFNISYSKRRLGFIVLFKRILPNIWDAILFVFHKKVEKYLM